MGPPAGHAFRGLDVEHRPGTMLPGEEAAVEIESR